ncbi:low specificity L-threonine aldolase [Actinomadura sp. HBU206391]|nr:low specificity L-threonine aldolase [Actinomadura sp. HBU206391]
MNGGVTRHNPDVRGFASDNHAGVHPEVLAALGAANGGHQAAYGEDVYTAGLRDVFREHFGERTEVYPVFNGTGANVVGLQAMCDRWGAVVCTGDAHLNLDECGAPEKLAGLKLLAVPAADGKLTPELIGARVRGMAGQHHAQPQVVSLTQSTELGTVYTAEEIMAICAHAHDLGMLVHVDGSRLANAAASLDLPLRAFTTDVGVDVLSFGGTKNGLLLGEAIVVLNPDAVRGTVFLRKAATQLASKMRFVSAQLLALLEGDLWLRNARHSNAMAQRLATAIADLPGVSVVRPVQANAVFAVIPPDVADRVRKRFSFHTWDEATGEARLMTAFDTTEDDVDAFAAALAEETAG